MNFKLENVKTRQSSFTLLELIVVIIVVGIFAGILTPLGTVALRVAKVKNTKAKIEILDKALSLYYENNAQFPSDTGYATYPVDSGLDPDDLTALKTAGYVSESKYADDYAYDAWRVPFVYTYNVGFVSATLRSYGPDRKASSDDIVYVVQAKDIWKKWRRTTQERLRKVNEAVEKYIRAGNTISSGDNSTKLSGYLDAADIYDPWGNPYYYKAGLSTFHSLGPDRTPDSFDEVYPQGVDVTPE